MLKKSKLATLIALSGISRRSGFHCKDKIKTFEGKIPTQVKTFTKRS